jgi:molybdopterin synthase sulfur carrier subunit
MIRVVLPAHLRTLARVEGDVHVDVDGQPTMRDQMTMQRRPFLRFFACEEDLSHDPPDAPLPAAVVDGTEPLLVVGAMAGG